MKVATFISGILHTGIWSLSNIVLLYADSNVPGFEVSLDSSS